MKTSARVRSHTRVSSNGKTHRVRSHVRTSFREGIQALLGRQSPKKAAWGTVGASAGVGLTWILSTAVSITAALIWAIILMCLGVLTVILMSSQQRRSFRRNLRKSAALGVKKRAKLWFYHRVGPVKKRSFRRTSTRNYTNMRPRRSHR